MDPRSVIKEIIDQEMISVEEAIDKRRSMLQLVDVRAYLSFYMPLMFPEQEHELRALARSYRKGERPAIKEEKKTWKRFLIR